MLEQYDSSVGAYFGLEFDGVSIDQITEISGLKMEQDVIELKQNTRDGKYSNRKLPGRPKSGELTITRGLTKNDSFEKWINRSRFGQMTSARAGGSIIVYDYEGNEVKRYKLINAWAKSLEISNLKAGDTSVLTEKLTLTYESLEVQA